MKSTDADCVAKLARKLREESWGKAGKVKCDGEQQRGKSAEVLRGENLALIV